MIVAFVSTIETSGHVVVGERGEREREGEGEGESITRQHPCHQHK